MVGLGLLTESDAYHKRKETLEKEVGKGEGGLKKCRIEQSRCASSEKP